MRACPRLEASPSSTTPWALGEDFCLSVLRSSAPLSLTDIAARLGATTAPPVRWGGNDLESLDRFNDPEQVCSYLVAELGPRLWTVLEYNDFQGTRPEVQRTLSAGVEQLTLFNGPHSAKLVLVRDGEVQVSLEPQFPWPLDRHGAAPGALDAVLEELVAVADADADEDWRSPGGPCGGTPHGGPVRRRVVEGPALAGAGSGDPRRPAT